MGANEKTQNALKLVEKGEALKKRGNLKEAIVCYKEAIEFDPECWKAYFRLSSAYKDARMRDEELNILRDALQIARGDQERAMTLNNLSDPLLFYEKIEDAIACLEQAVILEPDSSLYRGNLCGVLVREGEFQRSLDPLQRLRELAGDDDPGYLFNLGRSEAGFGHYGEAVIIFEKLAELYPDRKYAWRELARVYVELGWYADAERVCEDKMGYGLASCLILADMRHRTGRKQEAAAMTRKALEKMKGPSYFEEVRWHYCNRASHKELMAFVQNIAGKLGGTPWPHWILARLAVILDDIDMVRDQLHEVMDLDATLRPALETDDYFQHINI